MTAQASLDAQLESGNSPFADFTQFPESGVDVSEMNNRYTKYSYTNEIKSSSAPIAGK